MKFKSQVYTQASGSIGGTTYSRNKGGMYTRARAIPTNPNSTRQQVMRSALATLVQRWITVLTQVQRDAWSTYAQNVLVTDRLGEQIQISGQNHYIRSNAPRIQANLTPVDAAPTIFDTGEAVTSTDFINNSSPPDTLNILAMDSTAMSISLNFATALSDGAELLIYLGPPISTTRNFFKGPYQLAEQYTVSGSSSSQDWTSTNDAMQIDNGNPVIGEHRGMRARLSYDDGRLSETFAILSTIASDPGA